MLIVYHRLAFDTIGFCTFSFRFNQFMTENVHPFAEQMVDVLKEAGARSTRTSLETSMRYWSNKKYWEDINAMHKLCADVLDDRIQHPNETNLDLLDAMLNIEDPQTGKKLERQNVIYNMATFLIAGHETTSGTLTYLFYYLLTNPEKYHKVQQEVDEVLGDDALTVQHVPKLVYLDACIKETLRYGGPINALTRRPLKEQLLGGKYKVGPSDSIFGSTRGMHRDPEAWGDDCDEFKPERMIPWSNVKHGAFKPFGTGMRSCIGRAFAEQEMIITAALILQRFQVELADPEYKLRLKAALTVKPDGLFLKVRRRPGKSDMVGLQGQAAPKQEVKHHEKHTNGTSEKKPLTVLYGSNSGTCKAYADELVAQADGFDVTVLTLDAATERVPKGQPVLIICPSYEGRPADNAKKFVSWLEHNSDSTDLLNDVQYSVFGVGNSEWLDTYHKVPKDIDAYFTKFGASKITENGFVDVKDDPVGPWEDFQEKFLQKLGQAISDTDEGIIADVTTSDNATTIGAPSLLTGTVRQNTDLADASVGARKKHIEIELPSGVSYETGDYLTILAHNHVDIIRRVQRRFGLKSDDKVSVKGTKKTYLQTTAPMPVIEFLGTRVELYTPITQRQLKKLATVTNDAKEKAAIERLAEDEAYKTEVLKKRFSVLDILEDYPTCALPFASYIDMLKGMAMRQYSISSSPLSSKNFGSETLTASLSYDVHSSSEFANADREFNGVASSFLARLKPGDKIHCAVSSTNVAFHLPKDPTVPIIMIAAGTGLAPMHGFIEERAALAAAGRKLGPALLYYGCRDFEKDYIYKDQLEKWQADGVVQLRPAFSKKGPEGQQNWKYVPDRMWDERNEVADLFKDGGKIFLCGSASKLAKSTAETCKKIYAERSGKSEQEANEWLEKAKEDRYVTDVFG